MAKSKGNFYRLADVLALGYEPAEVRFLLLSTHYRKVLDFTEAALKQARTSRTRIRNFLFELRHVERDLPPDPAVAKAVDAARAGFIAALEDDLNISEALAALFELVKEINILVAGGKIGREDAGRVAAFIVEIDTRVLGCLAGEAGAKGVADSAGEAAKGDEVLEPRYQALIEARQKARAEKNFKLADEIRQELLKDGIVLEDAKEGLRWKRVVPPKL
jgi:cysteinyl-tRNA synthetase